MAVFTPITLKEVSTWLNTKYSLGQATQLIPISAGIENSNFYLNTNEGHFVLTIFERIHSDELPFYLKFMLHLAQQNLQVAAPIATQTGELFTLLKAKPTAIVNCLAGQSCMQPQTIHCSMMGQTLAKLHNASEDFIHYQPNQRGIHWWRYASDAVQTYLSAQQKELLTQALNEQINFQQSDVYRALSKGAVHADLFRNNVLFLNNQLSGIFDFYFAGWDCYLFDLAVAINDWCVIDSSGKIDTQRAQSLLTTYQALRPFDQFEQQAWPYMLRAAALRFWLSRLYDLHLPRDAQLLVPHNPEHFERVLIEHFRCAKIC